MRLSHLLELAGLAGSTDGDPEIVDVTHDSRQVRSGWLFVAVHGETQDGHDFVPSAMERGAAAIVAEHPVSATATVVVVPNSRLALADLAAAVHEFPSRRLPVLGVTGTDGKTTTCYLLASILVTAGYRVGLSTTVETRVGGRSEFNPNRMTTPDAATVQRLLAMMVAAGDDYAVLESSSHALAQDRLRGVEYRGAALTNIARDHLDYHGSREAYVAAKARLFAMVKPTPEPHIALNRDDASFDEILPKVELPFLSYGTHQDADVRAEDVACGRHGSEFTLRAPMGFERVALPLPGAFNVHNAVAAASLALAEGLHLDVVARGLEDAELPPGRLQRVDAGQDFTVYVDYAHTEQAFERVLTLLRDMAHGAGSRLIAVFGAAGSRDRAKRPRFGQIAGNLADCFVITNEDPFGEPAEDIALEIAQGAPAGTRGSQWTLEIDRRRAIEHALLRARRGDIVVITGKGHERSIMTGNVAQPWSDVDVARDILAQMSVVRS